MKLEKWAICLIAVVLCPPAGFFNESKQHEAI